MGDILLGDCLTVLRNQFADESVQCCVTSPPYWGLRDYGVVGQLGLEATPELYVAKMVQVFREVRRAMKKDGTLWLNLGDSHAAKQLTGVPWRVAFALQADGWYLRSDIIWHKPNAMPESVTDRPTKAHEHIFLLSKSARYYYDAESINEPVRGTAHARGNGVNPKASSWKGSEFHTGKTAVHQLGRSQVRPKQNESFSAAISAALVETRNKRSVWTVPTSQYADAHFAAFPAKLIEPCVLAGCPAGGLVLDPFAGSGTTIAVAQQLGRRGVGIELNADYIEMAERRCAQGGLAL